MVSFAVMFRVCDQVDDGGRQPIDGDEVLAFAALQAQHLEIPLTHQRGRHLVGHDVGELQGEVEAVGRSGIAGKRISYDTGRPIHGRLPQEAGRPQKLLSPQLADLINIAILLT